MKVDPRQLRVAEAVRLLNSTPLGEVVQPHVVYRHMNRAGYRISAQGNTKRIDLVRYAAWLFHARHAPGNEDAGPDTHTQGHEAHKDAVNARSRASSESSRDIDSEGWVHPPPNLERHDHCCSTCREPTSSSSMVPLAPRNTRKSGRPTQPYRRR